MVQVFEDIIHNCSGVGACRNTEGGTMCPSFRQRNEKDSWQGQANASDLPWVAKCNSKTLRMKPFHGPLIFVCRAKACKTEYPSNVDMSKLKSEVYNWVQTKGVPLSALVVRYAPPFHGGWVVGKHHWSTRCWKPIGWKQLTRPFSKSTTEGPCLLMPDMPIHQFQINTERPASLR